MDKLCRALARKSSSCEENFLVKPLKSTSATTLWIRIRKSWKSKMQCDTIHRKRLARSLQPDRVHSRTDKSKREKHFWSYQKQAETFMSISDKLNKINIYIGNANLENRILTEQRYLEEKWFPQHHKFLASVLAVEQKAQQAQVLRMIYISRIKCICNIPKWKYVNLNISRRIFAIPHLQYHKL